jgi:hypothetical protein
MAFKTGKYGDPKVAAPLVRKKKGRGYGKNKVDPNFNPHNYGRGSIIKPAKKLTHKAPEHIPGIPHTVEGYSGTSVTLPALSSSGEYDTSRVLKTKDRGSLVSGIMRYGALKKYEAGVKAFTEKQKARKRIKPIADPEAGQSERRRRAARRSNSRRRWTGYLLNA